MGLVEPAADYSILTLAYWDGWSTPSGVHCEAHFLIGPLAPEVKGVQLPQRLKPNSEAILKCTAEAVLHPDTSTQNLL